MLKKRQNIDVQGVHHVRRTCKATKSHPMRTLTSPMVSGNANTVLWGRPHIPENARRFSYLTGSIPVTPLIRKSLITKQTLIKPRGVVSDHKHTKPITKNNIAKNTILKLKDMQEEKLNPPLREMQQLQKQAIEGLAKCVKGYVLKEVKSTYELSVDGEKQIKSEIVTRKQISPEFAAIVFTLTNLDPHKWRAKPAPQQEEEPNEEEMLDLSILSEDQLVALLNQNA